MMIDLSCDGGRYPVESPSTVVVRSCTVKTCTVEIPQCFCRLLEILALELEQWAQVVDVSYSFFL